MDHVTTPIFLAMQEEWRTTPPLPVLVAAFIGYEAPAPAKDGKDLYDYLLKNFPSGKIGNA